MKNKIEMVELEEDNKEKIKLFELNVVRLIAILYFMLGLIIGGWLF